MFFPLLSVVHLDAHMLFSCQRLYLQVQKNLRDRSDENLMEHSQKQFGSELQTSSLLDLQTPHRTEVTLLVYLRSLRGCC